MSMRCNRRRRIWSKVGVCARSFTTAYACCTLCALYSYVTVDVCQDDYAYLVFFQGQLRFNQRQTHVEYEYLPSSCPFRLRCAFHSLSQHINMSFDKFEERTVYGGGRYNSQIGSIPFWVSIPAIHILLHLPILATIPSGRPVNLTIPGTPPYMVHSRQVLLGISSSA
jgi:hypothetical protein